MDSKLEEQSSVIEFMLLEDENPFHMFQNLFSKSAYPPSGNCCRTLRTAKTLLPATFICFQYRKKKLAGNKYETRVV